MRSVASYIFFVHACIKALRDVEAVEEHFSKVTLFYKETTKIPTKKGREKYGGVDRSDPSPCHATTTSIIPHSPDIPNRHSFPPLPLLLPPMFRKRRRRRRRRFGEQGGCSSSSLLPPLWETPIPGSPPLFAAPPANRLTHAL